MHIWANKIGPFSSPAESYGFYDAIPWCRPIKLEHRPLKLGETLAGDRLVTSNFNCSFKNVLPSTEICEKTFTAKEINEFINAITKRFVYELQLDSLPMKLFVGEISDDPAKHVYLYTHVGFTVSVNGPNIVLAEANPGKSVELKKDESDKIRFTYSVKWKQVRFVLS